MVFKQSSIHANIFPQGERYAVSDAAENGTGNGDGRAANESSDAAAIDAGVETAVNTPVKGRTPSHSRRQSMKRTIDVSGHDQNNIILVDWDGKDDPANPLNWPLRKKYTTTALLCIMCLFIGLATAAYSSGIDQMCAELGCSNEVGQVGLFLFNGAFSIVPMFLGPLSEFVGAQPVYLICYAGFVVFFIPLALAKNVATVLVSRFFLGCFGAAGTTIIPGTLASIFRTEERGNKVALFSLVAVLGTVGAPLYNGFIAQQKGWRWISWVQLIVNGAVLALELLFLRETRGSVILTRKARALRKQTGDQRFRAAAEVETPSIKALLHGSTTRAAILLVREPVVLFFSLWLAYEWALIFALFAGIPLVFQGLHGWGQGVGGLAYIAPILGTFFAYLLNIHATKLYDRARERNNGIPVPEARLYYGAVGGIVSTVGMFIFAFTSYAHVHWIGPEVGLFLLIAGVYWVFDSVQNYLSDAYGAEYGASAISAQGFVRNLLAASFPLFTTQMFNNLTIPYAGLMLACLLVLACPLPFVLIKYGERIRAKSRYAAATTGLTTGDGEEKRGDLEKSASLQGPVMGARRSRKGVSRSTSVATLQPAAGAASQVDDEKKEAERVGARDASENSPDQ